MDETGDSFAETLSGLLTPTRRAEIVDRLEISKSTLSNWTNPRGSRPAFNRLVGLSRILDVSLDYLVFGRLPSDPPANPRIWLDAVGVQMSGIRTRIDNQSALMHRLGQRLGEQIRNTAVELVGDGNGQSGVLMDEETLQLESHATSTTLAALRLDYGILNDQGANEAEFGLGAAHQEDRGLAGMFAQVMGDNIRSGRSYCFLLPSIHDLDWGPRVDRYRKMLEAVGCSPAAVSRHVKFWSVDAVVGAGFVVYDLDTTALMAEYPALHERLVPYIVDDRIGYVMPPSEVLHRDAVMDSYHLSIAREAIRSLKGVARPIA